MDCADLRDAFATGELPAGPDVEAHVRGCSTCAELLEHGGTVGQVLADARSESVDVAAFAGAVSAALEREVGVVARLRSQSTPVRIALGLGAALALTGVTLVASRRHDWHAHSPARVAATLGVYGLGLVLCVAGALRPLTRPSRRAVTLGLATLGLAAPFALGLWPNAVVLDAPHFVSGAFACLGVGVLYSFPFLALLAALGRNDRSVSNTSLLLAAAGGLLANFVLELHCALSDPAHLSLGHASAGLVWLLALVFAGARRPRLR